jgi:RNA polymerase sigma-70 factor (ECF subfamily)
MSEYSDEDLLVLMSFQKENKKEAEEAFRIFYNKYKNFLWSLCYSICTKSKGTNEGEELAKDVFNNTMMSIYDSSHTYDSKKSKVNIWMARIAKNEMLDLLKGQTEFIPLNEDIHSTSEDNDKEDTDFISPEKRILDKALNTLSEKEKDILLTYMQYSDGNKHLPDEVINELCQRYGTLPATLRQIKKRSLDKIKSFITTNKSVIINKNH